MAKQYHPDINRGSEDKFKLINEAYEVLGNTKSKADYDRQESSSNRTRTSYQGQQQQKQYYDYRSDHYYQEYQRRKQNQYHQQYRYNQYYRYQNNQQSYQRQQYNQYQYQYSQYHQQQQQAYDHYTQQKYNDFYQRYKQQQSDPHDDYQQQMIDAENALLFKLITYPFIIGILIALIAKLINMQINYNRDKRGQHIIYDERTKKYYGVDYQTYKQIQEHNFIVKRQKDRKQREIIEMRRKKLQQKLYQEQEQKQ